MIAGVWVVFLTSGFLAVCVHVGTMPLIAVDSEV